jgi:hypothetical protein
LILFCAFSAAIRNLLGEVGDGGVGGVVIPSRARALLTSSERAHEDLLNLHLRFGLRGGLIRLFVLLLVLLEELTFIIALWLVRFP